MSQFRPYAKAVAYFDLVLTAISLLVVIGLVIVAGTVATAAKDKSFEDQIQQIAGPEQSAAGLVNTAIWILCVAVALCAIMTAIQMWATIRLLTATEIGREPVESLRLASTWRNVSIVFLVFDIISLLLTGMLIVLAIRLLIRGGMMYIVFRYMQDLETVITSVSSVPVSITVKK